MQVSSQGTIMKWQVVPGGPTSDRSKNRAFRAHGSNLGRVQWCQH